MIYWSLKKNVRLKWVFDLSENVTRLLGVGNVALKLLFSAFWRPSGTLFFFSVRLKCESYTSSQEEGVRLKWVFDLSAKLLYILYKD